VDCTLGDSSTATFEDVFNMMGYFTLTFASSSSMSEILGFGVLLFEWIRVTDFVDFNEFRLVSLIEMVLVVVLRGRVWTIDF
jgi:hypothetical protein